MPIEPLNAVKPPAKPTLGTLDAYAGHVVRATAGLSDPRLTTEGLARTWPSIRPASAAAVGLADSVLAAARAASLESLRAPPYLLLQAYAVLWEVANLPVNKAAAEAALRDPAATIGRLLTPAEQSMLRALLRAPAEQRLRAGAYAGLTGGLGLGLGVLLGRLSRRSAGR